MHSPDIILSDLAQALDKTANYRIAPATPDVWAVWKEWLEKIGLSRRLNHA